MKVLDNQQWISGQFAQCQLGDERRTKRLVKVAAAILACPERSLPKQNSDWSDLKAAYRLCDNNQVTFDTVAMPHWQQTRNTKPGRYLLISDTTDAPQGVKLIRWVLLTSLPVETFENAWQVIEDYENRWLVEENHKVLKTGCRVEGPALRTAERLGPLIALTSVIGIRLFQLKLIGRSQPDAKAATHVPSSWLKCLRLVRPKLKTRELTVYEFFRELAKLGGFLARKGDGEPGWQTTWHGYQRLHALLDGLQITGAI